MNQESQNQTNPPPPPPVRQRQTRTPPAGGQKPRLKRPVRHRSSRQRVRNELSAGGVAVRNERGQWMVALLKTEHKRGEVWVLPKGHVEPHGGETVAEAARREVEEEAGISDLSVHDQLGVSRFTFQAENALVRKTVHYFLMKTNQKKLVPQEEEGFLDAAWFPIDTAIRTLEYDADQEIVLRGKEKLTGVQTKKARPGADRRPRFHT